MSTKRVSMLGIAVVLGLSTLTCRDVGDPVSPVEPQFAKGGKPGAPAEETFELLEFYVWLDGDGQNWIHVVGKGDVDRLNLNAVLDYPFNGIADGNHGPHYEYYTFPPPAVNVSTNEEGVFHADVPWDGARKVDSETGVVVEYFKDFLTHDVDGEGADPFAFWMWYLRDGESGALKQFSPQGIVLEGVTYGVERAHAGVADYPEHAEWDGGTIYSYATSSGSPASGKIFLEEVYLDPATVSCDVSKRTERIDKERITSWFAEVSGDFRVTTASQDVMAPGPGFWMEIHMVDMTDPSKPVFSDRATLDRDGADLTVSGTFTRSFPVDGPVPDRTVSFAVDYLFPTWYPAGTGEDFVYDPSMNADQVLSPEEAGFFTTGLVATTLGDHGPAAFSMPLYVTCK